MSERARLYKRPTTRVNYAIVGWEQWADAGETSSGLPRYLIELLGAEKIGELRVDDCYLFQIPGTHHLMRPEIKHENGHAVAITEHRNELYYANLDGTGVLIFVGEEPHIGEVRYAEAMLDLLEQAGVKRVVGVGGVYGAMPFDRDREVSCVYSLPRMHEELTRYAVRFSEYGGGATIGTYVAHRAEYRNMEMVVFYAFSPAYEFTHMGVTVQAMRVEEDWKSWYDLMRRVDYMLQLGIDLSDLEEQAQNLIRVWDERVQELDKRHPDLHIKEYLDSLMDDFTERPFVPLDEVWSELNDLLGDSEEDE